MRKFLFTVLISFLLSFIVSVLVSTFFLAAARPPAGAGLDVRVNKVEEEYGPRIWRRF